MNKDTKTQQEKFVPYGPAWEKEAMKLTKKQLIALIRKIKTTA